MAETGFDGFVRRLGAELKENRPAERAWHRFGEGLAPGAQWKVVRLLYWTTAEGAAKSRAAAEPALRKQARQRKLARQKLLRRTGTLPIEWDLLPTGTLWQVQLRRVENVRRGLPSHDRTLEKWIRSVRAAKRVGQYNTGHRGDAIRVLADFIREATGKPPGSISLAHLVNAANRIAPDPSIPGSGGGAMVESEIRRYLAVPENEL